MFLKLSDFEFFSLMIAAERYLTIWEYVYGAKLIREGRQARDASRTTYHGTGGRHEE
jgi:hypothetical protein